MTDFVPASRVTRIKSSPSVAAAGRVRELKAEGRRILDLTVGEPDFDTPLNIKEAAMAAVRNGETKYTAVAGTPELQAAIIHSMETRTGVRYTRDRLAIGGGAKQVIFTAFMASLGEGDEVVIPAPYWVSYPDMVLANEGTPVIVECGEGTGFKLTPGALAAALTDKTKWLILNTPSNPTGAVYSAAELRGLAGVLASFPKVQVLTDEIYDEIYFGAERPVCLLKAAPELEGRVLMVNGVSKSHAMTGWRLGYAVGPQPVIEAINKLQSQISSCPSSISQAAAAEALTGDQTFVVENRDVYRSRRDIAVAGLNAIEGLTCRTPEGAFYVYVNCAGLVGKATPDGAVISNDEDFTMYLLDKASVAVIQGSAYGVGHYFRISYATSVEVIKEALAAIEKSVVALN